MFNRIPENGKSRFIAVNILPSHGDNALPLLKEQLDKALALKFTHVWINPINDTRKGITCHRRCFDTGITTNLYDSLYAPYNPQIIHSNFPLVPTREIIQQAKEQGLFVMVDFVWKHVDTQSKLLANSGWKGKTLKDITEYNFNPDHLAFSGIMEHLKSTIDLYLHPDNYGFSGLRIDAASHLNPTTREELFSYIQSQYPEAIIFEETLFDRTQSLAIAELKDRAREKSIYSDFVTSNLYYQKTNAYGALPHPSEMGDSVKLQLANNNGISFTGNHDHFSIGWAIILMMAAKKLLADVNFHRVISSVTVSPLKSDTLSANTMLETITQLANNEKLIEELDADRLSCIRYLLPYANEIARLLLNPSHTDHLECFSDFQLALFEKMANRTLASMSGYFMLYAEIFSPFESHRIFFNVRHQPLPLLLLTVDDLKKQMDVTFKIIEEMKRDNKIYTNLTNFSKIAVLPSNTQKRTAAKTHINIDESLRLWLPYIIEYLRHHPEKNQYAYYHGMDAASQISELNSRLKTEEFIFSINSIFTNLSTLKCTDYHTFTSLDRYKIIVRCAEEVTDIIILNLQPDTILNIEDLDLAKIALWFQSRLYPPQDADSNPLRLSAPFDEQHIQYAPANYSSYWKEKVGEAFDHSYTRIVGAKEGHLTRLHLGYNLTLSLSEYNNIEIATHLKSTSQLENEIFHNHMQEPLHLQTNQPTSSFSEASFTMGSGSLDMQHTTLFSHTAVDNKSNNNITVGPKPDLYKSTL